MSFLFGWLMDAFHLFGDTGWSRFVLAPQPCQEGVCWLLMQGMFSDRHKDPCLWQGTAKLQCRFPSPPPTEVVFVANIKLTRCWRILFKGSQGVVRGGGRREGFNWLTAFSLRKAVWGMGVPGEPWCKGEKMLEEKCRLMAMGEGWKAFTISTGQCFANSCDWGKQSGFKLQEFFSPVKIPKKHLQLQGWYLTPFKTN